MKWSREVTLALLLSVLMLVASVLEPRFATVRAQALLFTHLWELAIVSVPMLLIIISAGIDLSVGAMVALSAVVFGLLFERGIPLPIAAFFSLSTGAAIGATNGWFISRLKVHPLLVTLATMAAFRGVAEGISLARPISGYPDGFLLISQGGWPVILFASLAVAAHLLLTKTQFGRWIVAIGTQENVAIFSGLPVARVKLLLYTFSGFACGLAALILVARNNTAKADLGMGMELDAITAVILGGASIAGGKGRALGLVLGLLLIHETREFVSWHWRQNELNLIVIGSLLLVTVLLERIPSKRQPQQIEQH